MLAWVYEAARACPQLDNLIVATDSDEVAAVCTANNWPVQLTSPALASGTDRVHAVSQLRRRRHLRQHSGRRAAPQARAPHHAPAPLRRTPRRSLHAKSPLHAGQHSQSQRREGRHRGRRPRPLFLPRHDPLQPRRRPRAVLETHRSLRLPQVRAQSLPHPSGQHPRTHRTP